MPVRRHGKAWQVRVQSAGQRVSQTVGNRADAFELERTIRGRLRDSVLGRTPRYSLAEAIERWLTGDAKALKSYDDLKTKVRAMYPYIQGQALSDVVSVAEKIKSEGLKAGFKPATLNRRLAILRRVSNLAHHSWGWLDRPVKIALLSGEKARHEYLTPEQVQTLIQKAPERSRGAILLAAMSGLRRAELLSLTASSRRDGALYLPDTKSGRPRVVPLPPEALKIPLPLPVTDEQLRQDFERARKAAKMPHIRLHDLRHTYASWLVQSGAPLPVVRDLLGHSSVAVTGRYSHLATEHLRRAVRKMTGQGRAKKRKKVA